MVRAFARIAWRLRIDLQIAIPAPPFVVAANHHSFLDPILIGAAFGQKIRFLALRGLFGHYRLLDLALRAVDVIPLQRGAVPLGPVREALRHLHAAGAVGVFPEGTRHREFDPRSALNGAAWLATRADVPLIPVAVTGTGRALGIDNRFGRGLVRITVGPPLQRTGTDRSAVEDLTARWASWVHDTLEIRE